MAYRFSGKPRGTLVLIPGRYVRLDVPKVRPTLRRVVRHLIYLNIEHYELTRRSECGCGCELPGRVRVRLVRGPWKGKPADPSSYEDVDLLPGFSDKLKTHTYWELAERGRPCWWELKVEHATARVGTRYSKATW